VRRKMCIRRRARLARCRVLRKRNARWKKSTDTGEWRATVHANTVDLPDEEAGRVRSEKERRRCHRQQFYMACNVFRGDSHCSDDTVIR
jgi:hypothetical protein